MCERWEKMCERRDFSCERKDFLCECKKKEEGKEGKKRVEWVEKGKFVYHDQ
jgi:hypothetical protein